MIIVETHQTMIGRRSDSWQLSDQSASHQKSWLAVSRPNSTNRFRGRRLIEQKSGRLLLPLTAHHYCCVSFLPSIKPRTAYSCTRLEMRMLPTPTTLTRRQSGRLLPSSAGHLLVDPVRQTQTRYELGWPVVSTPRLHTVDEIGQAE